MKAILKKVPVFVLTAVLIFQSAVMPAYADDDDFLSEEALYAGAYVGYVMDLIMENYTGGDIDYEELLEAAISGMGDVLDEYSYYMDGDTFTEFMEDMLATQLKFGLIFKALPDGSIAIGEILEGSSAVEAGLKEGDILIKANGADVSGYSIDEAITQINNIPGLKASVVFMRGEAEIAVMLEKRELANKTVYTSTLSELLELADKEKCAGTRVIRITTIAENSADELKAAIDLLKAEGVTKIILDLRNNTGGVLDEGIEICKLLVSKGPVAISTDITKKNVTYYSEQSAAPFEEVVVLVNDYTASAAELIATCLKDRGSKIIGTQSYGKGKIQSMYSTYTGVLKITTGEYLSPKGAKIDGVGIKPDIVMSEPYLLDYTLDTTAEDILGIKAIFKFCGLEAGPGAEYDDVTKATVISLKESWGMEATDTIDIYVKDAINEYYIEKYFEKDRDMEKAYEYLYGSVQ